MVLVDGLPLEGAFWGDYRTRAAAQRDHKQLIHQQRAEHRKRLRLPEPPMFRHRSREWP